MSEASRIHPLEGRLHAGNGVSLIPAPSAKRYNLRARQEALPALNAALGLTLPKQPKTSAVSGDMAALWLGPDEWLLIIRGNTMLEDKLSNVLGVSYSLVDISHRNTAIQVSGDKSVLALNSGCPQDLSLETFPVGGCSRTLLGKAEIVLWRTSETEFGIEVWRSFSDYAWKFLVDAAKSA